MRSIEELTHDAVVIATVNQPDGDYSLPKRQYLRTIARHHAGKSGYARAEETFFVAAVDYQYYLNAGV